MCSLTRAGEVAEQKENHSSDCVFVDVWNMWPLEYEQYREEKGNTRKAHTVIVEASGRRLKLFYPIRSLPRPHCELPKEVEVFRHHHLLDLDQCAISLTNPGSLSQLYSMKQPLYVRSKKNNVAFYPFPVVKRNKGVLLKLLKPQEVQEEMKMELDHSRQLLEQCRLLGQPEDLAGSQMINMLATRLGTRKKLVSKLGRLLKKLRLSGFQRGKKPIATKMSQPWRDKRCLWLQLSITADWGTSIAMEANRINLPSADLVETEAEQASDDGKETEQGREEGLPLAAALLASFTILDRELDELAFVLTLEKLELEVVVNIPPPHPSSGPSLWLGLARPPPIELQITAGGASPRLTQLLNKGMPMLRSAILARLSKLC